MMTARLIAFTDIHGAYSQVEKILARESGLDAIILGGDLTTVGTPAEAEGALQLFRKHGAPILAVAGNMDPVELEDVFQRNNESVNGRGVIIGDIGIFGVSAAPYSPLQTPYEISEQEIYELAQQGWNHIKSTPKKIFVPHAPPFGTRLDIVHSGEHVGSTSVRRFIEQYCPDLVLCGHIHEARGEDVIGRTRVVNCGPAGRGHYVTMEVGETLITTMQ